MSKRIDQLKVTEAAPPPAISSAAVSAAAPSAPSEVAPPPSISSAAVATPAAPATAPPGFVAESELEARAAHRAGEVVRAAVAAATEPLEDALRTARREADELRAQLEGLQRRVNEDAVRGARRTDPGLAQPSHVPLVGTVVMLAEYRRGCVTETPARVEAVHPDGTIDTPTRRGVERLDISLPSTHDRLQYYTPAGGDA